MKRASIAAHAPWEQLLLVSSALGAGTVTLEQLCPLESLAPVDGTFDAPEANELLGSVLHGLNDLEAAVQEVIAPTCQVYVLGIDTAARLAALCYPKGHSIDQVRLAVALLHAIGLVYRLPAALKFGYDPAVYQQVRISGWGRHHLTEKVTSSVFASARPRIEQAMREHVSEYRDLIRLCSSADRPLQDTLIHSLNANLPIPLVT